MIRVHPHVDVGNRHVGRIETANEATFGFSQMHLSCVCSSLSGQRPVVGRRSTQAAHLGRAGATPAALSLKPNNFVTLFYSSNVTHSAFALPKRQSEVGRGLRTQRGSVATSVALAEPAAVASSEVVFFKRRVGFWASPQSSTVPMHPQHDPQ